MKFVFDEKDPAKVLAAIKSTMGDRKLGEMVSFNMTGGNLDVVISKMGTSTISFKQSSSPKGLEFDLASEKIAFTHKPFKDDVTQKIVKVIEASGGKRIG